ncbi:hypothetical protein ACRQ5Q_22405 [Bradyrhizobium sp. PMVTL-01]|uniref:hypothetical protein n=1 Tax=Bradyrhizobium sp. PMVTL-01 TaxID=3434999 RepID=UPI003F72FCE9
MSDVRCLFKPGEPARPETDIVPRGMTPWARATRETLANFVKATSVKPLYVNEGEHNQNVEDFLDTMTMAERIAIEIEMQSRNAVVHSFDYDPLRG